MGEANGQTGRAPADNSADRAGEPDGQSSRVGENTAHHEGPSGSPAQVVLTQHRLEGHLLRTIVRREGYWAVAADVCRGIGLAADKRSFASHLAKLDPDEKAQISREELRRANTCLGLNPGQGTAASVEDEQEAVTGPTQGVWIVSESGLYTLILRSREATKPGTFAHRFRRWVTHEILPSIRNTGQYGGPRITYGSFEPDNTLPGRYVSLVGRDGKWHHYYSPYATVRNDMDAEDARTLAHGIKVIEGFWRKLQPLHGDQPDLLGAFAWHALGREIRSAAENADQLIAMHERRRLRKPDA